MILIHDLKKTYGSKVAVDIPEYTIAEGEILGLVGNNGAGKTTLFRLMLDLLKADSGNVTINDIDVSRSESWKNFTGAYLDESFLIDYLTPEEYFCFVGKMCGFTKAETEERIEAYSRFMADEIIGQRKYIRNLSAGNRQKVGIISALLSRPAVVILDEPFNFLDPSSQSSLKHLLREYNRETCATILVSSHNLTHTTDISTRIAVLEHGVIIRDIDNTEGTASEELEEYFRRE